MRTSLTTLLFLTLLLAACNLPSRQTTPSPDAIATEVAAQLTLLPTAEPPLATDTSSAPPIETATSAATTEPAQPTATPEATTTTPPSDPRLTFGDPTWREPFDTGNSFGLGEEGYSDDQTSIRVENGALTLTSQNAIGYHGWRTGGPASTDQAYVEGVFQVGACTGADQYGLVFRSPDYIDGYWFTVRCDGQYAFGYWADGDYTNLLDWQDGQSAIRTGSNQTNRLGVLADENRFVLYANGVNLQEITDTTFEEGGHVGVVIAGVNTPGFTVRVDEIAHWTLP